MAAAVEPKDCDMRFGEVRRGEVGALQRLPLIG